MAHGPNKVSAIGLLRAFSLIPPEESLYTSAVISWFEPFGAFTCAINIYAVAAISYKTWYETPSTLLFNPFRYVIL